MNRIFGIIVIAVGLGQVSCAATAVEPAAADHQVSHEGMQKVDRISALAGIDSWSRVDDDTVILWATPGRPYLVDLSRKARDLRFTSTIAVTSSAGSVYEKFDSVIVDGLRYPIAGIYKLDRASAKLVERES